MWIAFGANDSLARLNAISRETRANFGPFGRSLTANVSGIVKVDIVEQERTISEVTRVREGGDAQLHGGLHEQLHSYGTNVQ